MKLDTAGDDCPSQTSDIIRKFILSSFRAFADLTRDARAAPLTARLAVGVSREFRALIRILLADLNPLAEDSHAEENSYSEIERCFDNVRFLERIWHLIEITQFASPALLCLHVAQWLKASIDFFHIHTT